MELFLATRQILRAIIKLSSSTSISSSARIFGTLEFSGNKKTASTRRFSQPVRIKFVPIRCPKTALKASIKIDFPAPVSPVKMFKPSPNSSSAFSIRAKFCTDKFFNILSPLHKVFRNCCTVSGKRQKARGKSENKSLLPTAYCLLPTALKITFSRLTRVW